MLIAHTQISVLTPPRSLGRPGCGISIAVKAEERRAGTDVRTNAPCMHVDSDAGRGMPVVKAYIATLVYVLQGHQEYVANALLSPSSIRMYVPECTVGSAFPIRCRP